MLKKTSLTLFISTSFFCFTQESVIFDNKVKPKKEYKTLVVSNSYAEIDFLGDEETMRMLKEQGVELPITSESTSNSTTIITTQKSSKNGEIPATFKYGEITAFTTTNGETKREDNPYTGAIIIGRYDLNNKFNVEQVKGENLTEQMKNTLITTLESVQQAIDFPDKPMKVGDTFHSDVPMSIPIEGFNAINMKIKTDYFLKEIVKNTAFFEIEQEIVMDMSQEEISILANGSGSGTAEYNIEQSYLTKYNSTLPMEMSIDMGDGTTMKVKMATTTDQTTDIK